MRKFAVFVAIIVLILTFSISAIEEGDYGYYDVTADGKVEIVDVLGVLREVLDGEGDLLRVIRTLKLVTSGKVVEAVITEMNMDTETATLLCAGNYLTVPMKKIGFDENYYREFYHTGTVTMTVNDDFAICAANATSRYDINEIHLIAGTSIAIVNGKEQTLFANPIIKDGILMINAEFLAEKLELVVSWNNTTKSAEFKDGENVLEMTLDDKNAKLNEIDVVLDAAMTTVDNRTYVPAAFVAEAFGAKATYYADTETLVIVKCFLPTVSVTNAIAKGGEEFALTLSLAHNPGVAGLQVEMEYDASAMSYTTAKNVSNGMYTASSSASGANPFKYVAAHLSLKEVKGDLTLTTVNFAVPEFAMPGRYLVTFKDVQVYSVYSDEIFSMKSTANSAYITITE